VRRSFLNYVIIDEPSLSAKETRQVDLIAMAIAFWSSVLLLLIYFMKLLWDKVLLPRFWFHSLYLDMEGHNLHSNGLLVQVHSLDRIVQRTDKVSLLWSCLSLQFRFFLLTPCPTIIHFRVCAIMRLCFVAVLWTRFAYEFHPAISSKDLPYKYKEMWGWYVVVSTYLQS